MVRLSAVLLVTALAARAQPGAVQGRVIEDHTGAPLAGAELRVAKAGAQTLIAELETDSAGAFPLPDLPEGEYRLRRPSRITRPPRSVSARRSRPAF